MRLNAHMNINLRMGCSGLEKDQIISHRVIGISDAKELMACIMKSEVKMKHSSGRTITNNEGVMFPVFVYPDTYIL